MNEYDMYGKGDWERGIQARFVLDCITFISLVTSILALVVAIVK
ncbi:MAG: hypothetical protein UF305_01120 [Oscillospiraceae bacterium]|nr:hypothetical protein [Oscillospiraceae bacterium]